MKKIITTILLGALTMVSVSSCRDAIDIVQEGELSNDAIFQSLNDVNQFLVGSVYSSLDVANEVGFTSRFTDEVAQGPNNTELSFNTHQYFVDTTNDYATGMWSSNLFIINRVNRLIVGSASATIKDTERAAYNSYLAEARAIRAYANARLIWYFSPDPKDVNALGGILFNDVPAVNYKAPRNTNGDIYKQIFEDLKFAEENLIDRPAANANSRYYITKKAINAIYAHVYLNKGDYPNAGIYAKKVIDQSGLMLTPAEPVPTGAIGSAAWHTSLNAYASTNPYIRLWNDANVLDTEVIFSLNRPPLNGAGANLASLFTTNTTNATGSVTYDMGRKLFNLLDARRADDIRRWAYVDPTSKIIADYATNPNFQTLDVIVIDKYPGKSTGTAPLRNDAKVFRLSDMYLIAAESAAYAGDFAGAANYVNAVRNARSISGDAGALSYATQADALRGILQERRLELAFEGHRYLDLKRSGKAAGVSIDRDRTDDKFDTPLTLPVDDYRMRSLPIPKPELQGNPDIQQNPGY
ncbi:RagB/SusD family nutrient uptake outer membrane protein [Jeotgalibaca porci]|uniref:RagB/SusD family nutrient uptake outer membrane protein n=1 Tax=Jeotgalibaca porci TaxID=1868793 RepID=UPI0035A09C5B